MQPSCNALTAAAHVEFSKSFALYFDQFLDVARTKKHAAADANASLSVGLDFVNRIIENLMKAETVFQHPVDAYVVKFQISTV
jgi:hypothetical protein